MSPRTSSEQFHNTPYSEETLTKLEIFQLYAREWLPVFLSNPNPPFSEIHLYDFFAGPGMDSTGTPGSPLRLVKELNICSTLGGFGKTKIYLHLFDANEKAIQQLQKNIAELVKEIPGVILDIAPLPFNEAFKQHNPILSNAGAAKLILIDPFGVDIVTDDVFKTLIGFPTSDFLFFTPSSILSRFRDHSAIKQKIDRPEDPYHVHRAVMDYYKRLLPDNAGYFLSAFSIKKPPNIYGLIFGSAHPLGIDKFLRVAWAKDSIAGEANFDIDRENILPGEQLLPMPELLPNKIGVFQADLEKLLRDKAFKNESQIMRLCFEYGMTRQHAAPVLAKLKKEGILKIDFRVPDVDRWSKPRPIEYTE